jgi:hypothetical protein
MGAGLGRLADRSLHPTGFGRISVGLYHYYSMRYHRVSASLSAAPLSDHRYQLFEDHPFGTFRCFDIGCSFWIPDKIRKDPNTF